MADLVVDRRPVLLNVGQNILLIRLADRESSLRCRPNQRLRDFCLDHGLEIVTIFALAGTCRTARPKAVCFRRCTATWRGNAALGYQLLHESRWSGAPMAIEQGPDGNAPNLVHLRAEDNRILIGGSAVCRFSGNYYLL